MSRKTRVRGPVATGGGTRRGTRGARLLSQVAATVVAASGLAGVSLAATTTSAVAAAPLECDTVYSIQGASPRNLWALGEDGTQTSVGTFDIGAGGSLNGLGIADGGGQAFGVLPATTGSGRTVYRYDRATETTTALGAGVASAPVTHGALNPLTGFYYYGGFSGSSIQIYGFDTTANTSIGLVASGTIPTGGANGDWAFDQQGRLYVVGGANGSNVFSVIDQQLPTSGSAITVTGRQVTDVTTPSSQAINGIAFGGTGYLYMASGAQLFEVNPSTGAVVSSSPLATSGSVDLASCASPSTIRVQKDFPDGRVVDGDQATLSVTGGGLTRGNTATTAGTDAGLQDTPGETAGPVFGLAGTTYTISESGNGALAGRYTAAWACVDENNGSTIASGTGTSGTFTLPNGGADGVAALCTFTNEALRPGIELDKVAGTPTGATAGSTITYSFTVTNTGDVPLATVAVSDPKVGTVTCPPGPLAPGDDVTCTAAPYVLTQADVVSGVVDNTAVATGTTGTPGGPTVSDDDSTSTPIDRVATLTLDKSAGVPVDVNSSGITDAGDTIGYSFTVTNDGNVPVSAVAVVDPMVGAVTCDVVSLAPGAVATCEADAPYVVTEADEVAGAVVNVATAQGVDPDGDEVESNEDSTSTPVQVPAPSVALDKRAGAPVDVNSSGITDAGDTIAYTFVVSNTGNVPLSSVAITDPLVSGLVCPAGVLAVGGSVTCTAAPYVITRDDVDAGSVENTATAGAVDPDGDPVASDPDSTSTPTELPQPALVLEKVAGTPVDVNDSGLTDAGDTIAYTFTVTNTGNVPVDAVRVRDPRVGAVTCEAVSLAPGDDTTCEADDDYVVTELDEIAGAVVNVASAIGSDPYDEDVVSDDDTTTTPVDRPAPGLAMEKVAGTPVDVNGSGITDAGDTIAFTFTVTNTGNVPVSDIEVDDPMVGAVTCEAVSLAPGDDTTCEADAAYVVTDADEVAGVVANTATASGTDPDGDPVDSDPDSTNTPVSTPAPALTLDKSAGVPVDVNSSGITDAGDTIGYSFTVTNDGNVPVSAVAVVDPMVGAVTCDVVSLAPGAVATCEADAPYVVTEADEVAGAVVNVATAQGVDPDGDEVESNEDSTSTPVQVPAPSVALDKRAGAPVDVNSSGITDAGDTIAYTFVVSNTGNVPLSSVAITDPLVSGLVCPAGVLAVGGSVTCTAAPYVITRDDVDAGSVENTATAGAVDPDGDPVASDPDSTSTPIEPVPALELVKLAELDDLDQDGLADLGEEVWYGFEVTNTGNVTLLDVAVDDPKVGAVTCEATTLRAGDTVFCVVDEPYVVTQEDVDAGSVLNEATASGTPVGGGDPVDSPPSSTDTPADDPAAMTLVKTNAVAGGGPAEVGDTITYTFEVTNTGAVTIDSIEIDDPMLDDAGVAVACRETTLAPGAATTCEADYEVTADDVADGPIVNRAAVRGCTPSGCDVLPPVVSDQSDTTTPVAAPAAPAPPAPAPAPGSPLPDTGGPAAGLIALAALLLAAGAGLVWRGRRRRTA
ncbi:beta strand repeat-containing protein [Nocardioides sp. CPCC 205120]|uniref:beta strand repeat-containing protein n=1 Tax=Nocardioides sp. CPCC 205120 TaxID=3406462 RepID=UPI003B5064CA